MVEYAPHSQAALERLQQQGVTPQTLLADWGIILWSLKVRHDEIKVKVHGTRFIDERALKAYFQSLLGPEHAIVLKFKPLSKCCHSGCEGCLSGHPQKRTEWIDVPFNAQRLNPQR